MLLGLCWLVLSHAWFTDDAYFSFRTVDNLVNGYGLTWNTAERVQAFTNPLWVLLLSIPYLFTKEIYLTTIFTSLLLTLGIALIFFIGITKTTRNGILAILLLSLSTAFIDYSTSGLENPLSHFIWIVFLFLLIKLPASRKKLFWLSLVASLGTVNRLDTILFFVPPLVYEWWLQEDRLEAIKVIALGMIPLLAWEVFSVIYYGFPFPATFYAKTQVYLELRDRLFWGLTYLEFTAVYDPITWVGILGGIACAIWFRSQRGLSIAVGMVLYILYVAYVGGDFMGGRFLSTAYLGGVFLIVILLLPKLKSKAAYPLLAAFLVISLTGSSPSYYLYPKDFQKSRWPNEGVMVVDERREYYTTNFVRMEDFHNFNSDPQHSVVNDVVFLVKSILRGTAFRTEAENDWIDLGKDLRAKAEEEGLQVSTDAHGFSGYYAGPNVHYVLYLALTDDLLAHLPPYYEPNWRMAHFGRVIPEGYIEVEQGTQSHLDDPEIDRYFQKVRLITAGSLFTSERWQAIWEINTKGFNGFLADRLTDFRFPNLEQIPYEGLGGLPETGITIQGWAGVAFQIDLGQAAQFSSAIFRLSGGDNFKAVFIDKDGNEIGETILLSSDGLPIETYQIIVPSRIQRAGYAAVRIEPIRAGYKRADYDYTLFSASFSP